MKDNKRIENIAKGLRHQLEDIIVKLNDHSPQQLHDELVPLIEDIEILEASVGSEGANGGDPSIPDIFTINPQITSGAIRGSDEMIIDVNEMMGMNGADGPIHSEVIPPSSMIFEAYEKIVRLICLCEFEIEVRKDNESLKKVLRGLEDLRVMLLCLMHLDLPAIDSMHMDDKDDPDNKGDTI